MEDGFHSNHVLEAVSPGERTTMRAELERGRKEGRKEGRRLEKFGSVK